MSDYHFPVSVSRDEVVTALTDGQPENASYILTHYAAQTGGTYMRDELLDVLEYADDERKQELEILCRQILNRIAPEATA